MQYKNLLIDGLNQLNITYSTEQIEQIEEFYKLYSNWSQKINLSTLLDEKDFIIKHVLDSATALSYFPDSIKHLGDIGSGGGFPGIILKILKPSLKISLIDVIEKKVNYLKEVSNILELKKISVYNGSQEKVGKLFDVMTCRAFGNLSKIVQQCKRYLKAKGEIIAYKGKADTIKKEVTPALASKIKIEPIKVPFLEDSERNIVRISL